MLEWLKILGPIILSWPVVGLVIVLVFRKPLLGLLERFSNSSGSKAEIGPLKIELGKLAEEGKDAVGRLNRTTELMAESRLLELEITSGMFGSIFSDEQQATLKKQIEELRLLTSSQAPNPAVERGALLTARPDLKR
ncbi:hypothetical protein [Pseudomonas synxantha]|uniref:Uncharacterized protein n=1 Tax=Pseudomonas synxantha TaxID=47883 RepID=A0ACC6JS58_9PSED|nr:hypothetical protein [Pseudomonas synxantha]MDR6609069.1 hypothetical protein [Pseudomonas synxantha]